MEQLKKALEGYIAEDVGSGDVTSESVVGGDERAEAVVSAKGKCIVAGLDEVGVLFGMHMVEAKALCKDGEGVGAEDEVMRLKGRARGILTLERTALNILGRMSGVATRAKELYDVVQAVNPKVKVVETRKTAPGLRLLDKRAVKVVTGCNHRAGLWDAVLVKDNHLKLVSIEDAVAGAKKTGKKVEVEVRSADTAVRAAKAGADAVLLDNMNPGQVQGAVDALEKEGLRKGLEVEVSGGIEPGNVKGFAALDVDVISSGWITRAAGILDFKLRVL